MERLILKYLNGNLTKAEEYQLKEWLQKDEINRKVFENIVADWSLTASDIEKSKKSVYRNVVGTLDNKQRTSRIFSYFAKVAAVLIVFLLAILLLTKLNHQNLNHQTENSLVKIEKHALPGQKLTLRLPDGTKVTLNSGSKLVTPEIFTGSVRKVFLDGEAFFDVAKDSLKPFMVETNQAYIKVSGTSFNIRAYFDEKDVSVAVNSGEVSVSDRGRSDEHVLQKNEMLIYSIAEKSFSKQVGFDRAYIFGWKDHYLVFKDESIEKIFKRMSRLYDVEFKVIPDIDSIKKKKFTAKFKNQTLEAVMKSISFSYEFDYEINGKEVVIKPLM